MTGIPLGVSNPALLRARLAVAKARTTAIYAATVYTNTEDVVVRGLMYRAQEIQRVLSLHARSLEGSP